MKLWRLTAITLQGAKEKSQILLSQYWKSNQSDSTKLFFGQTMYILASVFFEKDDKYVLLQEIRVPCREFLAFKYVLIVFFKQNRWLFNIYICTLEILKTCV